MSHRPFFISVIGWVLVFAFSARSQETAPLRAVDESTTALRKKAIDLLESVAGQVDSLRSAENRARIGSNVAELFWNHDEKRARSLFAAVQEDIKAGFNDTDTNDEAHNHTLMVFGRLRSDTLDRIAKHDPELALEFLRATRPPSDMQLPYEMRDGEKALELKLASQIAAKNPQLALKLGRQSLTRGFSPDLLSVLSQLQLKDKGASLSFHKAIVDKLKDANLVEDWMALEIAMNLAHSFRPPEANEQVYRDLIGVLLTSALANGCAEGSPDNPPHYICVEVGSLFSRMEIYYGARAAPLKRWAGDEQGPVGPPLELRAQVGEVIEKGTVDEIRALAEKYPEMQGQIYWQAMSNSGDSTRARQIASSAPDDELRRNLLEQLDHNQSWKSVNAEKLAAIQQGLTNLRNNEDRLHFLLSVVSQIGGDDRKAALGLLNQASQIIASTRSGKTQLGGQLRLAALYCSLKSDRGFAIMESLMPKLNELVTAAAALDGIDNNYLRDGEWNMTGEGGVGGLLNGLAQDAGYFAAMDFDRSVTLARQFERPELRLMAELRIAQSVLTPQPNRAPMFQTPLRVID